MYTGKKLLMRAKKIQNINLMRLPEKVLELVFSKKQAKLHINFSLELGRLEI
jgi:hypothetical protein